MSSSISSWTDVLLAIDEATRAEDDALSAGIAEVVKRHARSLEAAGYPLPDQVGGTGNRFTFRFGDTTHVFLSADGSYQETTIADGKKAETVRKAVG